jgi:adenylyltransferase/sulfurtransferase
MQLSTTTLNDWRIRQFPHQLVDIREPYEIEICNIGGLPIPMNEILDKINLLAADTPVVIHCNSGKRSKAVVYTLVTKYEMNNVYSLCGGIQSYAQEVNPHVLHAY